MLVTLRTDKSVVMFSESFIENGLQELAHVDVSYNFTQELSSKTQVTNGLFVRSYQVVLQANNRARFIRLCLFPAQCQASGGPQSV